MTRYEEKEEMISPGTTPDDLCADAGTHIPRSPLERQVTRYGCPYCGRSRSKRSTIASHMARCWKNPRARTCGTCEHHIPRSKGEAPDFWSGYPGSPPEPRACAADVDNDLEMPRACAQWEDALASDDHILRASEAVPHSADDASGRDKKPSTPRLTEGRQA